MSSSNENDKLAYQRDLGPLKSCCYAETQSLDWEDLIEVPVTVADFEGLKCSCHALPYATIYIFYGYWYVKFVEPSLVYLLDNNYYRPICFSQITGLPIKAGKLLVLIGVEYYCLSFTHSPATVLSSKEVDAVIGLFNDSYTTTYLGFDIEKFFNSCSHVSGTFKTNIPLQLLTDNFFSLYPIAIYKLHDIMFFMIRDLGKYRVFVVSNLTSSFLNYIRVHLSNALIYPESNVN